MTRRAHVRTVVVALSVGLAAAACGGLPVGAGAHIVRAVGPAPPPPAPLREIPPGPTKGMSPADVVSGFLRAANDSQVADSYLAPNTTWDAQATSTVESAAGHRVLPATATATGWRVQVQVPQQAVVGSDGVVSAATGTVTREFTLVLSGNEWRIAGLAPGSVYSLEDLTVTRRLVTLNWVAPTSDVLVREPVLLTTTAQDPLAVAVHALLAGPPADLPVGTAFPAGTRVNSVETEGSTVVVDLTAPITKASRAELAQATAQLAATLLPLTPSSVTAVRIVADGLAVADAVLAGTADVARLDPESVVGAPIALVRHGTGVVDTTALATATPATEPKATRSAPLAQSTDGHRSAWLAPGGDGTTVPTVAVAPDADPDAVAAAGHWSSLSFDRDGSLWLVAPGTSGSVGTVVAVAPGEAPVAASIPAALQKITALHLSRDGVHGVAVAGGRLFAVTVRGGTRPVVVSADPLAPALSAVTVATAPTGGEVLAVGKVGSTIGVWQVATDISTSWQSGVLYPAPVAWGTPCEPTAKGAAVQPSDLAVPPTGAALGVLAVCDGVVRAEPAVAAGTSVLQPSGAWSDVGPGGGVAWPGG